MYAAETATSHVTSVASRITGDVSDCYSTSLRYMRRACACASRITLSSGVQQPDRRPALVAALDGMLVLVRRHQDVLRRVAHRQQAELPLTDVVCRKLRVSQTGKQFDVVHKILIY